VGCFWSLFPARASRRHTTRYFGTCTVGHSALRLQLARCRNVGVYPGPRTWKSVLLWNVGTNVGVNAANCFFLSHANSCDSFDSPAAELDVGMFMLVCSAEEWPQSLKPQIPNSSIWRQVRVLRKSEWIPRILYHGLVGLDRLD
jgi:hypothetical protein